MDHAVRQHREVVQLAFMKVAVHMQAQTSATVHVVDEDEFTAIGFGFGKRRKFSRLRTEGEFFRGEPNRKEQQEAK